MMEFVAKVRKGKIRVPVVYGLKDGQIVLVKLEKRGAATGEEE